MSEKFYVDQEEMVHYTTAAGLQGIVSSKTLWASHINFCNDTEEGAYFCRRILPLILRPEFKRYVEGSEELSAHVLGATPLGADPFEYWLAQIVEGFKQAQEKGQDHYVTSFSTAKDDWISQNGLLSQWRGYGLDGGYAIVFDAKGLAELLNTERERYEEECWTFGDVQYDMEEFSSVQNEQVLKHFQRVRTAAYEHWMTADASKAVPAFDSIEFLSAFSKHRGFEEEKEVRILLSKPSLEVGPPPSNKGGKAERRVYSYLRDGAPVPCIHLFEDQKLNALPIRRVIVGPSTEKKERKKAVEILLRSHGSDAKVCVSDTPFRGK